MVLKRRQRWVNGLVIALVVFLESGGSARAGGFEIPDNGTRALGRGGAFVAGASDLTAIHYNPARLSQLKGTRVLYNHNLVLHELSFQRKTLNEGWAIEDGSFPAVSDSEELFALGGFAAISSDFGLEDWTFAAGVYGPSSIGKRDFPDYGPQAFILSDMEVLLAFYTLSAAYAPTDNFSVGLSAQWVDLAQMSYSLVVDAGQVALPSPIADTDNQHTYSTLNLEDRMNFTAILGFWWGITEHWEWAAAGRVVPVPLNAKGTVDLPADTDLQAVNFEAVASFELPVQARTGLRFVHDHDDGTPWYDMELSVFYENWSAIDAFDVALSGTINGETPDDIVLPRKWMDTVSVRLGSDYHFQNETHLDGSGGLTLRAGGFWESAATPSNYEHLDFPSFQRFAGTGGLTYDFGPVSVSAAYAYIHQEDREVDEEFGKVVQQRPLSQCPDGCDGLTGVIANAGTFRSNFQIFSVGLDTSF